MRLQWRAARALAARHLRSYAETPAAYIALLVFFLYSSYLFALPLFLEGQATVKTLGDFAPLLLTLLVPALTMGLLAEEMRSGTFETLATLPLEDGDIVLGKFAAFAALSALAVGAFLFFAAAVALLCQPPAGLDWGEALGTISALVLLAWLLGAAGLFASSWSKSQVIAYIGAFLLGFALFLLGKITQFLPGPAAPLADFLGFDAHVRSLAKGVVDTRDLAYFASLTFAFLFLAAERLRRSRFFASTAGSVLMLGCVTAFNLVSQLAYARLDLSQGGAYSLSSGTRETLRALDDTLVIRVYFTPRLPGVYGLNERYLRDLLGEYAAASRRVRVEYVAPVDEAKKLEARAAGVIAVPVQVLSRDKFEAKEAYMGATILYKGKSATLPVMQSSADLEYDLTRRVRALAQKRRKTVGFLTGHGEKAPGDADLQPFFDLLSEQLDLAPVSIATVAAPSSLAALWVLNPVRPMTDAELARLTAFADSGKSIGLLLSRKSVSFATFAAAPLEQRGMTRWLKDEWGLEERAGMVVDAQAEKIQLETDLGAFRAMRLQDYPFIPVVTRFNRDNPAVKRLQGVSFPFAHPIETDRSAKASYVSLADTSPDSWYTEAVYASPQASLDKLKSSEKGPFSAAGVATRAKGGRLILLGTGYIVDPRSAGKAGAMALLANLIDWSFQDEALLSIRAKGVVFRPLRPLGDAGRSAARWLLILALPCALATAGALSYRKQRERRAAAAAAFADA